MTSTIDLSPDVDRRDSLDDLTSPAPSSHRPTPTYVTAGEIMSSPVGVIDVDESLWHAALRLSGGSLDRGRLVGVIDEKILTDHWPRLPIAARERTLRRVVSGRVHAVMPHVSVSRVAAIMHVEGVDAVPVVDRGRKGPRRGDRRGSHSAVGRGRRLAELSFLPGSRDGMEETPGC